PCGEYAFDEASWRPHEAFVPRPTQLRRERRRLHHNFDGALGNFWSLAAARLDYPTLYGMDNGNMIEVANLTKRFAGRTAVADISFTVARGEIVGLLGPNGAGKSTTMRILACFLPATS